MMPEEVAFSNSGDRNEEGLFLNPEDIAFWKYVVYMSAVTDRHQGPPLSQRK
jgi:hypothetical protein